MKFLIMILAVCVLAVSTAQYKDEQCSLMKSGRKGPKVVTTTAVYMDDSEDESNWNSRGCSGKIHAQMKEIVNAKDMSVIKSTWEILKKDGDFAPKVFIRFFKVAPETQRLFPKFANVPLSELPKNGDFLVQAYTCVSSINSIAKYSERSTGCPLHCPVLAAVYKKYSSTDVQKLSAVWMSVLEEELGSNFNTEVKNAWERVLKCVGYYITVSSRTNEV